METDNINSNYIYLLQTREFVNTKEPIYKVGRTSKPNLIRFNQYPNGSILLFQMICNSCKNMEKLVIDKFRDRFIQKRELGLEYFQGDYNLMIDIIYLTLIENRNNNIANVINNRDDNIRININEVQVNDTNNIDIIHQSIDSTLINNNSINYNNNTYNQAIDAIDGIYNNVSMLNNNLTNLNNCISKNISYSPCFKCKRCGKIFDRRGKLLRHYNRAKVCVPVILDIPVQILKKVINDPDNKLIEELLRSTDIKLYSKYLEYELTQSNIFIDVSTNSTEKVRKLAILNCKYCTKKFSSYSARIRHEKYSCRLEMKNIT